jgi:hypothetical protein
MCSTAPAHVNQKVPKLLNSPYSGNQSIPSHCCLTLGLPDDSSTWVAASFFNEQQEQLEILAKCGSL